MDTKELQAGMQALFEEALAVAIGEIAEDGMTMPTELEDLIRVESFEDAGILTSDAGLVLRFKDGFEAQITIIRSK